MWRAFLAAIALLGLAGCSGWISDERLLGTGDWAHVDLNGPYENELQIGEKSNRIVLRARPDGLIEGTGSETDDRSLFGLVAIRGGSGEYFLAVDRSDSSTEGDQYFIAHLSGGNVLALYLPDCRGTSSVEGMRKTHRTWVEPAIEDEGPAPVIGDAPAMEVTDDAHDKSQDSLVCRFSTKDALMEAGLEAERFLSEYHVVAVTPFATLSPAEENGAE